MALLALICVTALPGALRFQSFEQARVLCLTNERRLSTALLLYSEDHDGCFPPPATHIAANRYRSWVELDAAYINGQHILQCPINPVLKATNVAPLYPFNCSYALNGRFYGRFSAGPFPVASLEMPASTVLLVETAALPNANQTLVRGIYTDTAQNSSSWPSPHRGKMNIVAADGHAATVDVAHYSALGHDSTYGRIGRDIYNWNGGHHNGQPDSAPLE